MLGASAEALSHDLEAERERILSFVDIAPHQAVHQVYALVERELLGIYNQYLQGDNRKSLTIRDAKNIRRRIGISDSLETLIGQVRALREMSMRDRNLVISEEDTHSYVELCLETTSRLRKFAAYYQMKSTQ